jgi:hypothetical protein
MNTVMRTLAAVFTLFAGTSSAQAALLARDLNGDTITDAYYDTALNITWLRDWNYAQTSGSDADGRMNWATADLWAQGLVFGGYDDWRLPALAPVNGIIFTGFSNNGSGDVGGARTGIGWGTSSEMGHLFYVTLGNEGYCIPDDSNPGVCNGPQAGWSETPDSAPFLNMQSFVLQPYWTERESSFDTDRAWGFDPYYGTQGTVDKDFETYAVAVRAGDVGEAVPEPQSLALVLLALGTAVFASRQRLMPASSPQVGPWARARATGG